MSELMGQLEMSVTGAIAETTRPVEGYDEDGNLINPAAAGTEDFNVDPGGDTLAEIEADRLAVEINAIKEQTRGAVIAAALAIGKRLLAARALIPYGRWESWLAENVDYSHRKALDLINLYEEYGKKTIPQAIAELDYTKAVALLSLPEEERIGLAEQAAGMSTRELQAEIKRLKAEKAKAQMTIEDLEGKVAGATEEIARLDEREQTYDAAIVSERQAADRARAEAKAAGETAEALKKERDEAKKTSKLEIARAREAVKSAEGARKELGEARARIAELEAREPERVEVERIPEAVAEELERLRAAGGRSENVMKLRLGYERLMAEFKAVEALLAALRVENPDEAAKYAAAIGKACDAMKGRLEGEA